MLPYFSETSSLTSGLLSSGAAPYWSAVVGAAISGLFVFFAARHTAAAQLQAGITAAFQALMKEWQDRHAADIAHISELQRQLEIKESENVSLLGESRNLRQKLQHYENYIASLSIEEE